MKEEILEPDLLMFNYKGIPMFGYQHVAFDNFINVREDFDTPNTVISKNAVFSLRPAKVVPLDTLLVEMDMRSRCEKCHRPLHRTYTDDEEEISFEDLVFCGWDCVNEWVNEGNEPISDKYVPINKDTLQNVKEILISYWRSAAKNLEDSDTINEKIEDTLEFLFPGEFHFATDY